MPRATRHIIHDIHEIATRVAAINTQINTAIAELVDAGPGYPTSSGSGGVPTLNADGKPRGLDRYLVTPDPARDDHAAIDRSLAMALDQITLAHQLVVKWSQDQPSRPVEVATLIGECVACGHLSSGRLRSGLCDACRQSWKRYQERAGRECAGGDRAEWMLTRRRDVLTADA